MNLHEEVIILVMKDIMDDEKIPENLLAKTGNDRYLHAYNVITTEGKFPRQFCFKDFYNLKNISSANDLASILKERVNNILGLLDSLGVLDEKDEPILDDRIPLLRDHFAIAAMQTMLAGGGYQEWKDISNDAYNLADAMLEDRNKYL